jgi:hypothetical protein
MRLAKEFLASFMLFHGSERISFKSGGQHSANYCLPLAMQLSEASSPRACQAADRRVLRALIRSQSSSIDSTSAGCIRPRARKAQCHQVLRKCICNMARREFDTVSAVPHTNVWRPTNSGETIVMSKWTCAILPTSILCRSGRRAGINQHQVSSI